MYLKKSLRRDLKGHAGDIVLGLNDALVEMSGSLTGFTFALANTKIIAGAGIILGLSASLSMAASEYLAAREYGSKKPVTEAIYTGVTYILTVCLLIAPYLFASSAIQALKIMAIIAIVIIAGYTYYISRITKQTFFHRFMRMVIISVIVASISFIAGILVKPLIA